MAIETFSWRAAGPSAQGDVILRTRSAQFGDGYKQVVADGINNKQQTWPMKFVGDAARIRSIMDFIDRHAGYKSFYWTPPQGVQGLYRIAQYTPAVEAAGVYSCTASFEQAFHP
ncbi:phage tail protein [Cupriavidus gilardii]|uniref:Phage tail protein n=1 Tax=Cupriavidus gilardii TaxID=82541 RepID=A0ABY4VV34_9BURK|nr:phage tail protein [Cupriavidus gilardii]USE81159.1 phage tail protein [Cupriavidus gilardii]